MVQAIRIRETAETISEGKSVTRREFLNYVWAASAALLFAEAGGAAIWFALPHGVEIGLYKLKLTDLSGSRDVPIFYRASGLPGFWLSFTDKGLLVFSLECTYKGCFYKWVTTNHQFACPCCGSRFSANGERVFGPAKRNLDRYPVRVNLSLFSSRKTPVDGGPVSIDGATEIIVDTRHKILGKALPL
jgi:cytochrome b6-f complex iron-sulfur subunit